MKLLFAHDHIFDRDPSGCHFSEKFPYSVWKPYLEHFSQITMLSRSKTVDFSIKSSADGEHVNIESLPSLSCLRGLLLDCRKARRKIVSELEDVDAVIVRLPSEIGLHTYSLARKMKIPVLVEMAGCPWDSLWHYGTLTGKLYAPINFFRSRAILRKATHVAYVTKSFLQKRYPTSGYSVAISNVKIPATSGSVLNDRLRKQFPMGEDILIGLTGNLLPYKGIATLLEAGSMLRAKVPPFRLLFLGGGNAEPWKRLANELGIDDCCEFIGTLPSGKPVLDWLDKVDIYVQPSFTEGVPRGTLEAMSRGCPVLATTVGGIPDLLPSDKLFKPKNSKDLSLLICKMISDVSWRTDASVNNFQEASRYTEVVLDKRRRVLLSKFLDSINSDDI